MVKLALRNQITDAVESDYLTTLINTVTDKIPNNIPAILIFLQTTYDRISPVELMQKEDDLKDFSTILVNQLTPLLTILIV